MKFFSYFLIIVLVMLPTLVGYMINTDMHFTGLTSATDADTYLSIMNQAKEGHWIFTNMFTSENVPYLNIPPTYMLAGWFAGITGLSNVFVYHLFRIIGIILFVYFLEKLISLVMESKRKTTLFICIFASGIGFFFKFITLLGFKQYGSIDLWISDANNFLILFSHPHTIFSIALMTGSVYYLLRWYNEVKLKPLIISGIFAFILGFEHLFDVITIYLALGFFILDQFIVSKKIDWKKVRQLIIFGLITATPFIYTYIMFTNPAFASWNDQNVLDTPKLLHVMFGYGFMFVSFIGFLTYSFITRKYKTTKPEIKFIIYWIISVLILIYSPLNIQRRFLEGVHIPFGIITGLFLFTIVFPYLKNIWNVKIAKVIVAIVIILMLPTNIYHLFNNTLNINNGRGVYPYETSTYIYPEEDEALHWLAANSEKDAVIISTYNIGNQIPAYMNRRVYLGHWAQTIDLDKKAKDVEDYFKLYKQIIIDKPTYVWYGVDEKTLNPDFKQPDGSIAVFNNAKVTVYKLP